MRKVVGGIAQKRVGKQIRLTLLILIGLCLGAGMANVQAQTAGAVVSRGSLIYEGNGERAALYAADIHLLEDKISTIPESCFDPLCYPHTHNWEYCRINERTHPRHCVDCGEANDLTNSHRAESWEDDTITYEGKSYPGKRFTCACGYQWSMEVSHTMIREAVDDVNHQIRCALDGTSYCQGCEPSVEEHYAWYYEMGEDESHHEKICLACGFRMEESCRFGKVEGDEGRRVCVCGREEKQEKESDPPETEDAPEEPETPDQPGTEDAPEEPETPDSSETEDAPEEPETPDSSGTEDAPEEPETPDPPETGDTPGEPEIPDSSGTEAAPGESETPDSPGTGAAPGEIGNA